MHDDSSQGGLQELLGRALVDQSFRDLLYQDRLGALQGYDLSGAEVSRLGDISIAMMAEESEEITGEPDCYVTVPPPPEPEPKPEPEPEPEPKPTP